MSFDLDLIEKRILYEILCHCLDYHDWMRAVFDPAVYEKGVDGEHMESAKRKLESTMGLLLDNECHREHMDNARRYEQNQRARRKKEVE